MMLIYFSMQFEDCLVLFSQIEFRWADYECFGLAHYICERPMVSHTVISINQLESVCLCLENWYAWYIFITLTSLCCENPFKPHFIKDKVWFAGLYIIFLFWVRNIDCGYSFIETVLTNVLNLRGAFFN